MVSRFMWQKKWNLFAQRLPFARNKCVVDAGKRKKNPKWLFPGITAFTFFNVSLLEAVIQWCLVKYSAPSRKSLFFLSLYFIYRNQERFSKQYKRMIPSSYSVYASSMIYDYYAFLSWTLQPVEDWATFIKNLFTPLNNGFISTNNGSLSSSFVFNQY